MGERDLDSSTPSLLQAVESQPPTSTSLNGRIRSRKASWRKETRRSNPRPPPVESRKERFNSSSISRSRNRLDEASRRGMRKRRVGSERRRRRRIRSMSMARSEMSRLASLGMELGRWFSSSDPSSKSLVEGWRRVRIRHFSLCASLIGFPQSNYSFSSPSLLLDVEIPPSLQSPHTLCLLVLLTTRSTLDSANGFSRHSRTAIP